MIRELSLIRTAARRAMSFRLANGVPLDSPCDIYQLIPSSRVDLQFVDIPSLEGMYLDEPESHRICVGAHRPVGRQRFTAAHELGHHVFQHGTRIDAIIRNGDAHAGSRNEELIADTFARYILMPSRAVQTAFRLRNVNPSHPDPASTYSAACWLGVGYETLLSQMECSLKILASADRKCLSKTGPKAIKAELYGGAVAVDVWPLDELWAGMRLHCQIGDVILGLQPVSSTPVSDCLLQAAHGAFTAAGVGNIHALLRSNRAVQISISRRPYVGFYEYRYMAE